MAADVIFNDGRTIVDAITAGLREVQRFERARTRAELAALERERWIVLGSAAFVWFIVVIALMSRTTARPTHGHCRDRRAPNEARNRRHSGDSAVRSRFRGPLPRCAPSCRAFRKPRHFRSSWAGGPRFVDASGTTLWLGAGEQLFAVLGHGYSRKRWRGSVRLRGTPTTPSRKPGAQVVLPPSRETGRTAAPSSRQCSGRPDVSASWHSRVV